MPPITVTRPPTDEELALLTAPPAKFFDWWSGIVSGLCVLALVFLLVLLATAFLEGPPSWAAPVALAAGCLGAIGWYAHVQLRERRELSTRASGNAAELAVGQVLSTTYDVQDAIAVEESEDEGMHFYLLLDDGRTLFLSGQYLYDPTDQGFPWLRFEIVRVPIDGWVVAVRRLGASLPPSRTRSPFTDEEHHRDLVPEDGALLTINFQSLKETARWPT